MPELSASARRLLEARARRAASGTPAAGSDTVAGGAVGGGIAGAPGGADAGAQATSDGAAQLAAPGRGKRRRRRGVVTLVAGRRLPEGPQDPPVVVRDEHGVLWFDFAHPTQRAGRARSEVTEVGRCPALAGPLFDAMVEAGRGSAPGTCVKLARGCAIAAARLAGAGMADMTPVELPRDLFAIIEALDAAARGRALTPCELQTFNPARAVFAAAPALAHVDTAPRAVETPRRDAWSLDDAGGIVPAAAEVFGDTELELLAKRCAREIRETVAREEQFARFLSDGDADGPGPAGPELLEAARALLELEPARPLTECELGNRGDGWAAVVARFGWREIARTAFPLEQDMIPFVTMLGLQSRLNAAQLGMLDRTDFAGGDAPGGEVSDPASGERIRAAPIKMRSHRPYPVDFPVTAGPEEPSAILAFVELWTARLRPYAGDAAGDSFIHATLSNRREVLSFAHLGGWRLRRALKPLCARAGVPPITPRTLRLAGVDLVHELSGGDPMTMRAAGNWADLRTGIEHYFGAPALRRDREAVAMALLIEERRRCAGVSVIGRPAGADLLSATDGWRCANPFDGPLGREGNGGPLCAAVGMCPICPHGDVDVAWPAWSLTRLVALLAAVEEGLAGDRGEEWRAAYAPVPGELLELWLPLFPPGVVDEARGLPPADPPVLPDAW